MPDLGARMAAGRPEVPFVTIDPPAAVACQMLDTLVGAGG